MHFEIKLKVILNSLDHNNNASGNINGLNQIEQPLTNGL